MGGPPFGKIPKKIPIFFLNSHLSINVPDLNVPDLNVPDLNIPDLNVPDVNVPDVDATVADVPVVEEDPVVTCFPISNRHLKLRKLKKGLKGPSIKCMNAFQMS